MKTNEISLNNKSLLIEIAKSCYEEKLKKIAFDSFSLDRFHSDHNIPDFSASFIKSEWISNYFKGLRGDNCFVCKVKNDIVGFLLVIKKSDAAIIDLIAVEKKHRGFGVGKCLINKMGGFYKNSVSSFLVGTQLNNKESILFYESAGFKFFSSSLVWHYHKKS